MSFSKTQKCSGVIVCVAVLGLAVAKADIRDTIQSAKSGTTVTVSGSYSVSAKITVPSGVTVKGPATFNFTSSGSDGFYVGSSGANVTLQSLTVKGANHGIMVYGSGCKITSCTATGNHNTGIELIESSSKNNTVSGCTSFNNADSSGGNADGFGAKQNTSTGNKFSNCTAYSNSDDGWDVEASSNPVTVTGCLSYSEGSANGKHGNGNGFKMGISGDNVAHVFTSCVAHNNTAGNSPHGFSTNHNTGKIKLTTCHSYSNGSADVLGNCVLSNCTMQN